MDYVLTSAEQLGVIAAEAFFSVIVGVFLYTCLGLLLTGITCLVVARRHWASRSNRAWDLLAKFHYLAFLLAFMLTMPLLGAVRAVDSMSHDIIDEHLQPTVIRQIDNAQQAIVAMVPTGQHGQPLSVEEVTESLVQRIRYTPDSDGMFGQARAVLVNWLVDDLGRSAIGAMVAAMARTALGQAADVLGADASELEFTAAQIRSFDYSGIGTRIASAVDRSVSVYLDGFFLAYYLNLVFLFGLLIGFSVFEMLFYNLYWKKRRSSMPVDV